MPGWDLEDYAWSVLSGRTQEEIAQGMPARKSKRKAAGDPDRVWESDRPAKQDRAGARRARPRAPPKKKRGLTRPA